MITSQRTLSMEGIEHIFPLPPPPIKLQEYLFGKKIRNFLTICKWSILWSLRNTSVEIINHLPSAKKQNETMGLTFLSLILVWEITREIENHKLNNYFRSM